MSTSTTLINATDLPMADVLTLARMFIDQRATEVGRGTLRLHGQMYRVTVVERLFDEHLKLKIEAI